MCLQVNFGSGWISSAESRSCGQQAGIIHASHGVVLPLLSPLSSNNAKQVSALGWPVEEGAEGGLLSRQFWGQILRWISHQLFSGRARAERQAGLTGKRCSLHNKNVFHDLFFSLRIADAYLLHLCLNAFQTRMQASGRRNVPSWFCRVFLSGIGKLTTPPQKKKLLKTVSSPWEELQGSILGNRFLFLLSVSSSFDLF